MEDQQKDLSSLNVKSSKVKTNEFSFCGKTFHSKVPFQKQGATHTGETTFDYSNFRREQRSNLKRDICNRAKGKSYQCCVCFKTFRMKKTLDTHSKTHSKRPYRCSLCSKTYKWKNRLLSHIMRVHKEEQLLKKVEMMEENLVTPTNSPVEDRPFKCPLCNKTFAFNSSLKTHTAHTHNKDQGSQISQIGSTFSQSVQCFKHGGMQHSVHNNPQGVNSLLANGLTFEKAPLTIPANVDEGSLRTDDQNMYEFPHIFHVKVEENDSDQW